MANLTHPSYGTVSEELFASIQAELDDDTLLDAEATTKVKEADILDALRTFRPTTANQSTAKVRILSEDIRKSMAEKANDRLAFKKGCAEIRRNKQEQKRLLEDDM